MRSAKSPRKRNHFSLPERNPANERKGTSAHVIEKPSPDWLLSWISSGCAGQKNYRESPRNSGVPLTTVSSGEWYIRSWARGPRAIFHGRVSTPDGSPVEPWESSPSPPTSRESLTLSRFRRHLERCNFVPSSSPCPSSSFSIHFVPAPFSYPRRCLLSLFAIRPFSPYSLTLLFRVRSEHPAMRQETGKGIRRSGEASGAR